MARRGARHLIFLSRSDPADAQARAFTAELRTLGVDVQVIQGNVSNISDVRQAVKACGSWPLKGVVQAALNLHVRLSANCATFSPFLTQRTGLFLRRYVPATVPLGDPAARSRNPESR